MGSLYVSIIRGALHSRIYFECVNLKKKFTCLSNRELYQIVFHLKRHLRQNPSNQIKYLSSIICYPGIPVFPFGVSMRYEGLTS